MVTVKFFLVIRQVEWLNSEQTNVSRTISVLILRVVTDWIPNPQPLHNPEDKDRDGPRNVGLFTLQPLDPPHNPIELHSRTPFVTPNPFKHITLLFLLLLLLSGNLKGRDHFEDLAIDVIILERILKK
jgi:hypothetical protein